MSPISAKSGKDAASHGNSCVSESELPFGALYRNELLWSPYRVAANLLLQMHRNTAAMIGINRKLADELRESVRREQDAMLEIAEKMWHRISDRNVSSVGADSLAPESFDRFFETAIGGAREFGQAMADAQVRSIEALREHAHAAADAASHPATEHKAAA